MGLIIASINVHCAFYYVNLIISVCFCGYSNFKYILTTAHNKLKYINY